MTHIEISEAKRIREQLGMTHLVIFAVDETGQQHVATHGRTETNAREAAKAGNKLKKKLGWPEDLCNAKPLERICKNCTFYQRDRGVHTTTGWTRDGTTGHCFLMPTPESTTEKSKCSKFEACS